MRFIYLLFFSAAIISADNKITHLGTSVELSSDYSTFKLSNLSDKGVLIIFFQSWCGICNGWAPEMFSQVEKAIGDDDRIVKLALKTDGGSLSEAKSYLSKKADINKWIFGTDKDAIFYKHVTGDDGLYGYALIGTDGKVIEKGKAGGRFTTGNHKGKYSLAIKNYDNLFEGKIKNMIQGDYSEALSQVISKAELGLYASSISESKKYSRSSKYKDEVKSFQDELFKVLDLQIQKHSDNLLDLENKERFESFMQIRLLSSELKGTESGKNAYSIYKKYKYDKQIKNELKAESSYVNLMKKAKALDYKKRVAALPKPLKQFIDVFTGTYYAKEAEALLASLK